MFQSRHQNLHCPNPFAIVIPTAAIVVVVVRRLAWRRLTGCWCRGSSAWSIPSACNCPRTPLVVTSSSTLSICISTSAATTTIVSLLSSVLSRWRGNYNSLQFQGVFQFDGWRSAASTRVVVSLPPVSIVVAIVTIVAPVSSAAIGSVCSFKCGGELTCLNSFELSNSKT